MGSKSNCYMKKLEREIGLAVQEAARKRGRGWYTPFMAAASRAIVQRLPLVDFILEVRHARVPMSSEYDLLRNYVNGSSFHPRRIIVLNKVDLASRSHLKEWIRYFEQQNCFSYGVNSHNKDSVKEFLNFLQSRVRELRTADDSIDTATMMIVGIPNVGKSALANSLHQIGRISAAEKGRLKHAKVSPHPGETKDISSLKIASHPNIYVLDSPAILPPEILNFEVCCKLALTGAIGHCLVAEKKLARYFLAILNLADEHKKWAKFSTFGNERSFIDHQAECPDGTQTEIKKKKHYLTDHTQDLVVHNVRRTLYEAISCFDGDMQNEKDFERLLEVQFTALKEALKVPMESVDDTQHKVAVKLLNLYQTGRLGHYTLDCPVLQRDTLQTTKARRVIC